MPFAAVDIETHNAPRLISMVQFPPMTSGQAGRS
jgi:hypothetical protein